MSENSRIHADYAPWVQWQVFWLAVGWRTVFPTKLSVTRVFAPQRTAHSSGSVRDSHPVPFSSCLAHEPIAVQSYKKRWNNKVAKKIYYGPTLHTSQTKTYLSRKQKQVFHANRNISFTKTKTYLSHKQKHIFHEKIRDLETRKQCVRGGCSPRLIGLYERNRRTDTTNIT